MLDATMQSNQQIELPRKECRTCGESKIVGLHFIKRARYPDGYDSECRKCMKEKRDRINSRPASN